jgi:hypothetical protein
MARGSTAIPVIKHAARRLEGSIDSRKSRLAGLSLCPISLSSRGSLRKKASSFHHKGDVF